MTMTDAPLANAFLEYSRIELVDEYWLRLRHCVESLSDEQTWWRPNDATNSVGNIVLHLNGNVRQWLVSPFTGADDHRDRPAEFGQRDETARSVLLPTSAISIRKRRFATTPRRR